MPTTIQHYECGECWTIHPERSDAQECADRQAQADGYDTSALGVIPVSRWRCGKAGCPETFDDQWRAQEHESTHRSGADTGRQGPSGGKSFSQWMEALTS